MVHSYGLPPANPIGELTQGSDGTFYGTTSTGGAYGAGTLFKLTAGGVLSTLVEFTDVGTSNRGAFPGAPLIASKDGNFYGTTARGGAYGVGTIFKLTPEGKLTTLAELSGKGSANRGASPYAPLLEALDGNFYGTTADGGYTGNGTIFKVTPAGKLTTLVEFSGNAKTNKGATPYGGLVQDLDGTFYGTTSKGGSKGFGTVFKMTPTGALTTLVEFSDTGTPNKGASPYASLVFGPDRLLYGATAKGGLADAGTLFKMTTAGALTTLAQFNAKAALPESALVLGTDGAFYGTTLGGGIKGGGTIFRVGLADGALSIVIKFTGKEGLFKGSMAQAALCKASDGFLYGTTLSGGTHDAGTIFKLGADAAFTTLAEFRAPDPDTHSQPGLLLAADKAFYGATQGNGSDAKGTLFKISEDGKFTTLVEFTGNGALNKGASPAAALIQTADGTFYGSTARGGAEDLGTLFKMTTSGALTTLSEFSGIQASHKGAAPQAALLEGTDGVFYGTTAKGGASDLGTVFKISAEGILTTLVEFSGNGPLNKGASPQSALVRLPDGNLYGTTVTGGAKDLGTLFKMTPEGVLSTLVEFADTEPGKVGAYPYGALVLGDDGALYGTTATGGLHGNGTLFKFVPGAALATLLEFSYKSAPAKGAYPQAALVKGSDGLLYGTTVSGGAFDEGTVFKVSSAGILSTLAEFNTGGAYPESGLIFGTDGNLYGTTSAGGENGAGGIFKLRIRALATTGKPGSVQSATARLNAKIQTGSLGGNGYFEFGPSTSYGSLTALQTLGGDSMNLGATLGNLLPNTTYHFRSVVADSTGPIYGADETFHTSPLPGVVLATGDLIQGEPDSTRLHDFGIPSIGDDASMAVLAGLTTAEGPRSAILAGSPPRIVARTLELAPKADGSTEVSRRFVSFSDPVCDQTGHVSFVAKILEGSQARTGIWSNLSGALTEVASTGGVAPGAGTAQFKAFTSLALSPGGTLFYVGTLSGAMPGKSTGVWAHDALGEHLLLLQGDPLLGHSIAAFNVLAPVAGSPGQGRAYRGGTLSVLITLDTRSQAIVHFSTSAPPEVVAATGDPVSDKIPPSRLLSFGVPSIGPAGTSAFMARLLEGPGFVTKLTNQAIFSDIKAVNLAQVIRKGAVAPGAGLATFGALSDPVYNAQLESAFFGTLIGSGVTLINASGLWHRNATALALIARIGGEVSSVAGTTWNALSSLALPDACGPLFLAKLAPTPATVANPINATNNLGLWSVDATGAVRSVLRTGDVVQVHETPRTLSLLTVLTPVLGSPGQARSYNGVREVVCRATFSDRTQAVLRLHLP